MTQEPTHRAVCYQCHKPEQVCICKFCERVENKTHILILQHGRERRHPIGTAKIAMLTLARVRKMVVWGRMDKPDLMPHCALLYPGEEARPVEDLAPNEVPDQLIVLDGTWPHAQVIYRSNPWLHGLPQVSLSPSEPSRYRIRTEPKVTFISTIESIVQALTVLEPETPGLDIPIQVFDRMIEDQIRLTSEHTLARDYDWKPLGHG